jgi:hypothetical protein
MYSAHHVAWAHMEGEKKFGQAARSRRRASFTRTLFRRCAECAHLLVHDQPTLAHPPGVSVARARGALTIDAIVA